MSQASEGGWTKLGVVAGVIGTIATIVFGSLQLQECRPQATGATAAPLILPPPSNPVRQPPASVASARVTTKPTAPASLPPVPPPARDAYRNSAVLYGQIRWFGAPVASLAVQIQDGSGRTIASAITNSDGIYLLSTNTPPQEPYSTFLCVAKGTAFANNCSPVMDQLQLGAAQRYDRSVSKRDLHISSPLSGASLRSLRGISWQPYPGARCYSWAVLTQSGPNTTSHIVLTGDTPPDQTEVAVADILTPGDYIASVVAYSDGDPTPHEASKCTSLDVLADGEQNFRVPND